MIIQWIYVYSYVSTHVCSSDNHSCTVIGSLNQSNCLKEDGFNVRSSMQVIVKVIAYMSLVWKRYMDRRSKGTQ